MSPPTMWEAKTDTFNDTNMESKKYFIGLIDVNVKRMLSFAVNFMLNS